jgi:catechol 2,3-dioxygenase-like lactoylglutathione lyase family enzyme
MLTTNKVMAFVATRDSARARAFYEGTLGLRVVSDDDFALALDAGGTILRVQKVDAFAPHPFTALGWEVTDIATTIDGLRARGAVFARFPGLDQDDRGVWISPGSAARIAWFKDPDGNTLSLTQM